MLAGQNQIVVNETVINRPKGPLVVVNLVNFNRLFGKYLSVIQQLSVGSHV